jgi:hypothetical protein
VIGWLVVARNRKLVWGAHHRSGNDGLKDLFVANGIYKDLTDQDYIQFFSNRDMVMSIVSGNKVDYKTLIDAIPSVKIPNYAFKNMGDYRFQNMAAHWGLDEPSFSNGSAYGDLDNDGDLDLVVNNVNMPMFIYRNETSRELPGHHYLKLILKGEAGNTAAVGTKITVRHQGRLIYQEQMPTRGYLSSVDPRPNLGLGSVTVMDTLIVEWPDDRITVMTKVPADQVLTLYQKDGIKQSAPTAIPAKAENLYLKNITSENRIVFNHIENDDDFKRDKLIYYMFTEGPRLCKGDVNRTAWEMIFAAPNPAGNPDGAPGMVHHRSIRGQRRQ